MSSTINELISRQLKKIPTIICGVSLGTFLVWTQPAKLEKHFFNYKKNPTPKPPQNKRSTGPNGHLSVRDIKPTS